MLTVYVFLFSEQSSSLKCDGLPRRLSLLNLRITIYLYIYIYIYIYLLYTQQNIAFLIGQ